MKHSLLFGFILFASVISIFSQVPDAFNYQAVVRTSSGDIVANTNVSFRISILQNSETGSSVYVETHNITTNDFGLTNLKIGNGTRESGIFDPASWGVASHYIKVELDPAGGTSFAHLGTSQLLSVPYAFHAQTVEDDQVNDADADPNNELQTINLSGTQLSLSDGGGTVTLPSSGGGDNWGIQTVESDATIDGEGTTANPLSVVGNLTDDQTLSIAGNELSISDGNTVSLPAGSDSPWTSSGSDIYFNSGKVGIGTTTPSEKLDIYGGNINLNNTYGYKITGSGANAVFDSDGPTMRLLNFSGGPIQLYTTPTASSSALSRMYISKNGNIGLGTLMPQVKLHIDEGDIKLDDGNIYIVDDPEMFDPSPGYKIIGDDTNVTYGAAGSNMILNNEGGGSILFATTPTADGTGYYRFAITKSGKIGINTISPDAGLHLYGSGYPNSFMFIQSASGQDAGFRLYEGSTTKWHIFNNAALGGLQIYNSASKTAIFAKQSNSYVGIGTTNPTQALHVVGNAYKTVGGTSWATSSDLRLKNIKSYYEKGLNEIVALQPVRYIYKKDNPRQLDSTEEQVGFVAQEVQKIFPKAVSEAEDGYLDFNIHPINVAMINAVKELNDEKQQLKNKVNDLEARLEKIESLVELRVSK